MHVARPSRIIAIAASSTLLLTGCGLLSTGTATPSPTSEPSAAAPSTMPSDAAGTTQAQQCQQLLADVESIAADVGRLGEMIGTDLFGAIGLLSSISERVGALEARVTDPELLERIGEIQAGWDALLADAEASITSGDASGIERATTAMTELAEQVGSLQQFCASGA